MCQTWICSILITISWGRWSVIFSTSQIWKLRPVWYHGTSFNQHVMPTFQYLALLTSDSPRHLYILSDFRRAFPYVYFLIFMGVTDEDTQAQNLNTPKATKLVPNRGLWTAGSVLAHHRPQSSYLRAATKFWLPWQCTASLLLLEVEFYSNPWALND